MTISNETLMAFADGELQGPERDAVARAVSADPDLQRRVDTHRALRARLQRAFADELTEPVPERLITAARRASAPASAVTHLQDARADLARKTLRTHRTSRWQVGSIAASLLVGFGFGYLALRPGAGIVREEGGGLVAAGALADVLTQRLAAEQSADSDIRVGISFVARSGEYCRTFSTAGEQAASGLACRAGRNWQVQALVRASTAEPQGNGFRTAASAMSPLILQVVNQQIAGDPLDSQGEDAAKRGGWAAASR